ncbi:hypothetical protein DITRI_Ditri03aG0153100 [Diplodiscus trichospermus]
MLVDLLAECEPPPYAGAYWAGLSFGSSQKAVIGNSVLFRFWLDFGIGGDNPLSATIMADYSNKKTRGAFIAAVFSMQGFGILDGGAVAIAIASIIGEI